VPPNTIQPPPGEQLVGPELGFPAGVNEVRASRAGEFDGIDLYRAEQHRARHGGGCGGALGDDRSVCGGEDGEIHQVFGG
jgi:hypothetical protein